MRNSPLALRSAGLVPALFFFTVSCVGGNPAAASATTPVGAAPITIGVLLPFTESALDSDVGASQKRAAELFMKLHGDRKSVV